MEGHQPTARKPSPWSIPIGSIAGVTIRVHVTFLALLMLVGLTATTVGEAAGAVGWLVALFACVVLHELSHALVARSRGVAVHEIDLLPIGGISRMERLPDSWRDESAIAAAGPMASAAIGLVAFVVAAAAGEHLLPVSPWDGPLLVRLAWANLLLAAFNLLPAFPLDGGRVLRSLLERDRSRVVATRQAVSVSQLLASTMIGIGVLFNIWLVLIGLFVLVAGRAEEAAVLVHAALGPTHAYALAVACPVAMPSGLLAADGARMADLHPQPAYPVIGPDGAPLGTVNLGALLGAPPTTPVGDLASGGIVDADQPLEDLPEQMTAGSVLVVRDGTAVGVVTREILDDYLQQRLHEVQT